jgi:hypothetical protein
MKNSLAFSYFLNETLGFFHEQASFRTKAV